jgi:GxxExxY protein
MKGQDQNTAIIRELPPRWNEITGKVIGAAVQVHAVLGPGLLESLYEQAMCIELRAIGLSFESQKPIRMTYRSECIGNLRLDLVVEELVIVELKAIAAIAEVHRAQLLSYLRSTDLPLGLLFNFNSPRLTQTMCRTINPHCGLLQSLPVSPPMPSDLSDSSEFSLESIE